MESQSLRVLSDLLHWTGSIIVDFDLTCKNIMAHNFKPAMQLSFSSYRIRPVTTGSCLTFNRCLSLPIPITEECPSPRLDMGRTPSSEQIASLPVVQTDRDRASASKRPRSDCFAGRVRMHLNQSYATRVPQTHPALHQR